MKDVYDTWLGNPIIISFQASDTAIDQIPFPAFTICNINKIKKSALTIPFEEVRLWFEETRFNITNATYVPEAEYWALQYFRHYCEVSRSFTKGNNYSQGIGEIEYTMFDANLNFTDESQPETVQPLVDKAFYDCNEMIKLCIWKLEKLDCDELFQPIMTEFGMCCVFNMVPGFILHRRPQNDSENSEHEQRMNSSVVQDWDSWHVDKKIITGNQGEKDGHSRQYPRHQMTPGMNGGLSILVNPQLDEYFCPGYDGSGFKVEIHSPVDVPQVTEFGKALKPNSEIFVSVRAEVTITDDNVDNVPQNERQCYFSNEHTLEFSKLYTQRNCIDECVANLTYETCQCVRYYMPHTYDQPLCSISKLGCAEEVKANIAANGTGVSCPFCMPSCTQLEYKADTSSLTMREDVNLWVNDSGFHEEWEQKNVSIIHVFFADGSVNLKVRNSLYGWTDLLAQMGGLLGLTLGLSVVSLVEPLYFFTLRQCFKSRKKRRDCLAMTRNTLAEGDRKLWDRFVNMNVGFASTKILVNPLDAVKLSDSYSKDPKRQLNALMYPSDFVSNPNLQRTN